MIERFCRGCGAEFNVVGGFQQRDGHGTDCYGCHLCFDCAWPDCKVCGDAKGVRLNVEHGKVKPAGWGAVPWVAQ